tara:strand:+ start:182 stop:379 length:198 start_codon:yes stop_codon:yes gene_type:complete
MTEEDEEFNRIEREASMRKAAVLVAITKKEWTGLTDQDRQIAIWTDGTFGAGALWAEARIRERNT